MTESRPPQRPPRTIQPPPRVPGASSGGPQQPYATQPRPLRQPTPPRGNRTLWVVAAVVMVLGIGVVWWLARPAKKPALIAETRTPARVEEVAPRPPPPPVAVSPAPAPVETAAPLPSVIAPVANTAMTATEETTVAKTPAPQAPALPGGVHTVVRGDTLWDIAGTWYESPALWPNVYRQNADTISNPDLIYPGRRVTVPDIQSKPPKLTSQDQRDIGIGYFMAYQAYSRAGKQDYKEYLETAHRWDRTIDGP